MATAPVSAESESGMHGGKGSVFTVTRPYLHTYINIYISLTSSMWHGNGLRSLILRDVTVQMMSVCARYNE